VVTAITDLLQSHVGRVRVAIDGADAADPAALAESVVAAVPTRLIVHVRASTFWRQAALRLEQGRHDEESWLDGWLDESALRREVLDVASGRVLPALRDPHTDRALRLAPVELPPTGVVLVSGAALLSRGLPFDMTVHLHLSSAALARRTPLDEAWTLPALERYETERRPDASADLVVRWDDPAHPALIGGG
jgi:hypothetical protein